MSSVYEEYKKEVFYEVAKVFASYQGEGLNTGRPAIFIRLHGCNKNCQWCDTDDIMKLPPTVMSFEHIKDRVYNAAALKGWRNFLLVITGGEPTLQPISLLIREFMDYGFPVQVETNGARHIYERCFVSYSPKSLEDLQTTEGKTYLGMASEIKLVIGGIEDPAKMITEIVSSPYFNGPLWLQPLNNSNDYISMIENFVHFKPDRIRIGHQIHKFRRWE